MLTLPQSDLAVGPHTVEVHAWFNGGPDASSPTGWRWTGPAPIFSGMDSSDWQEDITADLDGDGRSDLITFKNGELSFFQSVGLAGTSDVSFAPQGVIWTGDQSYSQYTMVDINGDGRDDVLVWDDDAGLSGWLNVRSDTPARPNFVKTGGLKGVNPGDPGGAATWSHVVADIDGDGKAEYCSINKKDASLWCSYNRGSADTSVAGDGLRFADCECSTAYSPLQLFGLLLEGSSS